MAKRCYVYRSYANRKPSRSFVDRARAVQPDYDDYG